MFQICKINHILNILSSFIILNNALISSFTLAMWNLIPFLLNSLWLKSNAPIAELPMESISVKSTIISFTSFCSATSIKDFFRLSALGISIDPDRNNVIRSP